MSPLLTTLSSRAYGLNSLPQDIAAFESIATFTTTGGNTATFSSIPQTYKHLQFRITYKNDAAQSSTYLLMRLNGATTSTYVTDKLNANGANVIASGNGGATSIEVQSNGWGTNTAGMTGYALIDLHDYSSTGRYKITRIRSGFSDTGSGAVALTAVVWYDTLLPSTDPITSITLQTVSGNYASGTSIALYGIKG